MASMLDRKLLRDLGRLWAQSLAVALVMACGVMTIILATGATRSLEETRTAFYERYRFASIFASVNRAPDHLKRDIRDISGVSAVETRIVKPVILDIEGMIEPATGKAVSVPDNGEATVNRLYVRTGRLPEPGSRNEVAVTEAFADAHRFRPGDNFSAVMNGRKVQLTITAVVLSPEYIYAIGPGEMVPDPRRYAILFMARSNLAGLFDMVDAFNDLAVTTLRGADLRSVREAIDNVVDRYGTTGAIERADQTSHAFLDAELTQLDAMSRIIPPIFLAISAFLVNMILSRLISLEREQIGLLKAVGYTDLGVAWHYAKLAIVIAAVGFIIGSLAGTWLGEGLTRLYGRFFSFPFLIFDRSTDLYIIAFIVTAFAALAGATKAIWSTITLPPAVAMRPPAPERYRSFGLDALHRAGLMSQLSIMAFRNMLRRPLRTALTTLGTSMSVALLVTALFPFDSIEHMIDTVFFKVDRHDTALSFSIPLAPGATADSANLPGVLLAEPYRAEPVVLRNGIHERSMVIFGLMPGARLGRVLDPDGEPMGLPPDGLVISERVLDQMELRIGDRVDVELTALDGRKTSMTVVAAAQSFVGLTAYASLEALDRLHGNRRISGVRLQTDASLRDDLYTAVKATPAIAGVTLQNVARQRFRETIEENIAISVFAYVSLAVIITVGVIYNSARIQLSERARELASLRVFGFTRAEVSSVLLTELAVIVLLAQPLGWLLGWLFAWGVARGFESDLFRIPLVIDVETYAVSSLVVLGAALASALLVRRRIDRLDLIRVLKTRE